MKWLGILLVAVVAVLSTGGTALAYLSSKDARLTAEMTAYKLFTRKTWATDSQVGRCTRQSSKWMSCEAKVSGDEFQDCSAEAPYDCTYVFHSCDFTVSVHQAGYSTLGRIQGLRCTARSHSG